MTISIEMFSNVKDIKIVSSFFSYLFSFAGVTIGLASSPAAVYSAEIAEPKLRGRLTVLTSMAIAVGILMIYILGFIFPVNIFKCWPQFTFVHVLRVIQGW